MERGEICLQICWVTEVGHGNLGGIRNTPQCRKGGENWEFICLLLSLPAKSKAALCLRVSKIQIPSLSVNGQGRGNSSEGETCSVQHLPFLFCAPPWEQSHWQGWHCKPWQSSVQTSISLTAIFIYHSTLFNSCHFPGAPNTPHQLLQCHQLKKEPKYTISSNLAQMSHIFVLIFFPGGDLKAVGFLGY